MENRKSPVDDQGPPTTERGLLQLWQAGAPSEGLCPERVLSSRPVLQLALGAYHGLILTQGGQVFSFGELSWRRGLSVPPVAALLEICLADQTVVQVSAGGFHCGAVTEQGGVYMWGENSAGQCGLTERGGPMGRGLSDRGPLFIPEPSPVSVVDSEVAPPGLVRVMGLACGGEHTLALSAQHELWAWGTGCQLGLVTKSFPVWRPRKVEHLAGRHVIQVVCGGFHSLALVRSLPPQNYDTQNPAEQCGQFLQPSYMATEREEPVAVDDSHYCPLGVELAETTPVKGGSAKTTPRKRLGAGGRSANSSPGSGASPCPYSEAQKPGSTLDDIANTLHNHPSNSPLSTPSSTTKSDRKNKPTRDHLGPDGQVNPSTQTDSTPQAHPPTGWRTNRSSSFPDEVELRDYLQRLSSQSLDDQAADYILRAGDTRSLASQTSDESTDISLSGLTSSCQSASPVPTIGPLDSSYEDHSLDKTNRNINSSVPEPGSSAPVCVEEVRLRVEERQVLQGKKSSSLTDILQEEVSGASRRCSLPGLPPRGSPMRKGPPGCRLSSGGKVSHGSGSGSQGSWPEEAGEGLPPLGTEVWSWGRGTEGQLGHGDHLPRLQPLCIKSLTGEEVVKVAAGSHHSLALTAQCQVFSWGSNMCGQLGHITSPTTLPQQAKLSEGLRVWNMSAGQSHSLLLADGDCVQPIIYYCGQQQGSGQDDSSSQGQGSSHRSPNRAETYTVRPFLLPFCIDMGYVSSVFSGGQTCGLLSDQNVMGFISAIHELASKERQNYCWLNQVNKQVLKPLTNRDGVCPVLGQTCGRLFLSLSESFVRLSVLTGRHSVSLTHFLQDTQSRDVTSLPLLTQANLFLDAYKEYCTAVGNFQVMGGFQTLHKLSVECFGKQLDVVRLLFGDDQPADHDVLVSLFYQPIQHLHQYGRLLLKLATCYDVSTPEYVSLHHGCSQYESLSLSLWKRRKEAENTHLFWKNCPVKITDSLGLPERRLVCESRNSSLTLHNAGRFSQNWFILFNDALVHAQGTMPSKSHFSSHRVYPLTTLWVKPVTEDSSRMYAIRVTCPEEKFVLVASSAQEKNKWLLSLNQAVELALGGGQGSSSGVTAGVTGVTAVSRSASYTFTSEGRLKDAQYTGAWMAGVVHGRGTMTWPDGRSYTGNFKNGLEDGYGECLMPNKLLTKPDRYLGHWRDGKIHGFGTYWYASGEVYKGCFHDGQRHGYGMLNSGRRTRTSSGVFIGQWVHDRKTGYGVYDDITRGEKYMGLWLDDQRQGSAVVVTQYGLYYEGTFNSNKMTGPGLLVAEDDTAFQGEFSEDWTVNGKGSLSLPNGDSLEGMFTGEWSTGLKVVGTYTKSNLYEPDHQDNTRLLEVGGHAVPAELKWQCVFEECWSRLGCDVTGRGERRRAWENIAVTITTGRRESPDLSRSQSRILERLEVIPQPGEPMTTTNYDNIRRYLAKACETPLHPLGWLLETLVTAYRMTYVGAGSNRRLLRQAVLEIKSYLTRIFQIVRFLFPGLPDEGGFIPDSSSCPSSPSSPSSLSSYASDSQPGCVVNTSSLLLPVLLPRLYPPLFTLYCLEGEREEATYWDCVLRLNKQPDQSLLSFLSVHEKFWPVSISVLGEKKQIVSSSKEVCYVSAVETLQQISTTFTPSDKLLVIQRTFEELTQEVQPLLGADFLWSMDDLFPLFLYVVLRARIRSLGAEVSLIEDLMDPTVKHGELGLMLTTLKACYFQIQHEKTT